MAVTTADRARVTPGFTLVSEFGQGYRGGSLPQRPVRFDAWGDVRWVLDFADSWPLEPYGFHHDVIELPNGNFLTTATAWGSARSRTTSSRSTERRKRS